MSSTNYITTKTTLYNSHSDYNNNVDPAIAFPLNSESDQFSTWRYAAYERRQIMKSTIPPDLMDVVREMTTLLIHRYRSPLTGIMGFVELLKKKEYHSNDHYLETINNGLDEISGLLDEMEELNQEPVVKIQNVKINELIYDVISNYPRDERERILFYDSSSPVIKKADYALLSKMLQNLLNNALEHDKNEKSDVLIELNDNENISITNFGPPIANDFVSKMFYPFYSTKARNMGLGLTRASIFAKSQNFVIELTSNSEVDGIRFVIHEDK